MWGKVKQHLLAIKFQHIQFKQNGICQDFRITHSYFSYIRIEDTVEYTWCVQPQPGLSHPCPSNSSKNNSGAGFPGFGDGTGSMVAMYQSPFYAVCTERRLVWELVSATGKIFFYAANNSKSSVYCIESKIFWEFFSVVEASIELV